VFDIHENPHVPVNGRRLRGILFKNGDVGDEKNKKGKMRGGSPVLQFLKGMKKGLTGSSVPE